ncbi:hypothetical protein C5167_037896 [Papaver somniferum]|uniref:4a-hydroxytetrahydrobiopterin dehydratase n=1 Tax=Papaver somniferum TaxID=3469 RepID=A0A4Y7IA87_PAPSO|nr:hypothetical protein C5167_037896 [Papaver somniferum]
MAPVTRGTTKRDAVEAVNVYLCKGITSSRVMKEKSTKNGEAANDLSTKKCVSCSSKDLRPMTEEAAMKLIPEVQGWNLVNEEGTLKLNRSWKVKNFTKGLELFKLVADIAEAENHHPDLHLTGWNNVKIDIWTHSVSGLTENDFILASKINTLELQHLLRKKMKGVSNKAEE